MSGSTDIQVHKSEKVWTLRASGDWSVKGIHQIDDKLRTIETSDFPALVIDTSDVSSFDTGGAWLIERLRESAAQSGRSFEHRDTNNKHTELAKVVQLNSGSTGRFEQETSQIRTNPLATLGMLVHSAGQDFVTGCFLIGSSLNGSKSRSRHGGMRRVTSLINQMDHMGLRAVPVIALMSFLIGAIIAQQGAYQLKFYGEELLTVYLVAILHFREIAVLLTAVMVAGRTGSAITAEIGTMKMREEIDALDVIGLNPVGVLIFPRLLALIIVLPILTLVSDIAGIAGAIFISNIYIDITPSQFLEALNLEVEISHLYVGLVKAPFMAVLIGLIATIEGLKVGGSAESLGQKTTSAVVKSIFAVILLDGLFAIFFSIIDV